MTPYNAGQDGFCSKYVVRRFGCNRSRNRNRWDSIIRIPTGWNERRPNRNRKRQGRGEKKKSNKQERKKEDSTQWEYAYLQARKQRGGGVAPSRNSSTSVPVNELPARPRRQLLTMAHIHRIVPPRCRSETSWLRAGRVWACTRPLQSVCAVCSSLTGVP